MTQPATAADALALAMSLVESRTMASVDPFVPGPQTLLDAKAIIESLEAHGYRIEAAAPQPAEAVTLADVHEAVYGEGSPLELESERDPKYAPQPAEAVALLRAIEAMDAAWQWVAHEYPRVLVAMPREHYAAFSGLLNAYKALANQPAAEAGEAVRLEVDR